jgi:cellulose biosynthesis protein BcsQ
VIKAIALAKKKVILIDADPQGSSQGWAASREERSLEARAIARDQQSDRLIKKSRYIPRRLLSRVEKLEAEKAPVKEILEVLGVKG